MTGTSDREAAYARVVRETEGALYRYLRHLLHDEEAARDVFQETYLRVFRGLDGFRGEASVTTWVLTIGRNLALNRRRGEKLREERQAPLEAIEGAAADGQPGRHRRLLDALDALPEAQKEAVFLYYGEDRPVEEVSALTGRPANTVKSDLRRARARLRALLSDEEPLKPVERAP
jgi:RNA polymerase sigma-70 factor (ECF subfamily)